MTYAKFTQFYFAIILPDLADSKSEGFLTRSKIFRKKVERYSGAI